MKTAIMQPYFFPYFGYYQLCFAVNSFVFLDDVNFIKKGWINRNNINQNGNKVLLSIPLAKASQNSKIAEILVSDEHKWKAKFINSLLHAYKKAPFFKDRIQLIEEVLEFNIISIGDLAKRSISMVCRELKIETSFIDSSSEFKNEHLKGEERILDICLKQNATTYINPIGGVNIYNKSNFTKNNMDLKFIKMTPFSYMQLKGDFIPNLSMIDVLMFNSNQAILEQLNQFELI